MPYVQVKKVKKQFVEFDARSDLHTNILYCSHKICFCVYNWLKVKIFRLSCSFLLLKYKASQPCKHRLQCFTPLL